MTTKSSQNIDLKKGERLNLIRASLGLTQVQFTKKLNIAQNNLTAMEKGKRVIGPRLSEDICTTFAVNREWLEKGIGEMFLKDAPSLKLMVLVESPDVIEQLKSIKGVSLVSIIQ